MVEALRLSEGFAIRALASFLSHAAILQTRVGDFAMAERLYQRLDTVSPTSAPADVHLEFRAILALSTGRLADADRLAAQLLAASASRGPHLRTHSLREQCHVLLARGDWRALRETAAETEQLVSANASTSFCYAVTTARAFAAVAHALETMRPTPRAAGPRRAPAPGGFLERERALLAYGAVGRARTWIGSGEKCAPSAARVLVLPPDRGRRADDAGELPRYVKVNTLPPPRGFMSGATARVNAISEYALTSSAMRNPSLVVFTNGSDSSATLAGASSSLTAPQARNDPRVRRAPNDSPVGAGVPRQRSGAARPSVPPRPPTL